MDVTFFRTAQLYSKIYENNIISSKLRENFILSMSVIDKENKVRMLTKGNKNQNWDFKKSDQNVKKHSTIKKLQAISNCKQLELVILSDSDLKEEKK